MNVVGNIGIMYTREPRPALHEIYLHVKGFRDSVFMSAVVELNVSQL